MSKCISCGTDDLRDVIAINNEFGRRIVGRCLKCGLGFVDPPPTQEEIDTFYKQKYSLDYGRYHKHSLVDKLVSPIFLDMRIRSRMAYIKHLGINLKNTEVLEIGSAQGTFLNALRREGANVYGVEPSQDRAISIKRYNIRPLADNVERAAVWSLQKYDIIFAYHVLEHMVNPLKELKDICKMLRKGGYFIGAVPYTPQHLTLNEMMTNSVFDNSHLYHFNRQSLYNVLHKTGFVDIDIGRIELNSSLAANVHYLHSSYDVKFRTKVMAALQGMILFGRYLCGQPIMGVRTTDLDAEWNGPNDWLVWNARK